MTADRSRRITVVMPVYNEIATIEEMLRRVQAVDLDKEIVIIDEASTDGTREFLADLARLSEAASPYIILRQGGAVLRADNIRILFQDKNQGKGAALQRGFQGGPGRDRDHSGCGPRIRPGRLPQAHCAH